MSNMSYCRFHNTALDLQDCMDVLSENIDVLVDEETDEENHISDSEKRKAIELIQMCREITENFEDVDLHEHFK